MKTNPEQKVKQFIQKQCSLFQKKYNCKSIMGCEGCPYNDRKFIASLINDVTKENTHPIWIGSKIDG